MAAAINRSQCSEPPVQPLLFADGHNNQAATPLPASAFTDDRYRNAGKRLIAKVLKLRASLIGDEEQFIGDVNDLIDEIRRKTRLTDSQRDEAVLYAIERSGCTYVTEIAEDTRLTQADVKKIIESLHARGIVRFVKRYIPGNARPRQMIKSNRVHSPEADTIL